MERYTISKSSSIVLKDLSIIYGEGLEVLDRGYIEVSSSGVITDIGDGEPRSRGGAKSCAGLVAIPGFIDAHTHIADSAFRDAAKGGVKESVHPVLGLKARLLKEVGREVIREAIRETAAEMLSSGITCFADFREGGMEGVTLLRSALEGLPIRCITLAQPEYYDGVYCQGSQEMDTSEVVTLLELSDGLGLSGPNEYRDETLRKMGEVARSMGKKIAIHAAEDEESVETSRRCFGESEVDRAVRLLKPDIIIHATRATRSELSSIRRAGIGVVVCPRSNARLSCSTPDIGAMLDEGLTVALGTDNVMLCEPDMFREMGYTFYSTRGGVEPVDVLRMVTVNPAAILGISDRLGSLSAGKRADIIFLKRASPRLKYSSDLLTAIVARSSREDIACVMIDGKVVYGSL